MTQFIRYYENRISGKRLLENYGKYKIYLVDGFSIRNKSFKSEEFGGSGCHIFYPDVIPEDEIWIEDSTTPKERAVMIASNLYLIKQVENGLSIDKAYKIAEKKEKDYRESVLLSKKDPWKTNRSASSVHKKEYGKMPEGITVWLVNGEKVRDKFKSDFIEGANPMVYSWTPNKEIWIEFGPHISKEAPYILLHEFVEMKIMQTGKSYEKAHKIACKVEFSMREKGFSRKEALALTKEKALKLVKDFS